MERTLLGRPSSALREAVAARRFRAAIVLLLPILASLALSWLAPAQLPNVELGPELQALIDVKAQMRQALEELPSYTCAETIRRTQLNEKDRRKIERIIARSDQDVSAGIQRDFSDTVGLDVAVVDGTEMFSWPDARFQPVPPDEIVGFGMVTSGSFSFFAKALFINSQSRIRFVAEEATSLGPAMRYDHHVSLFRSGFHVTTLQGQARVGYEGSFWARADDHRSTRMTIRAKDVPPQLDLQSLNIEIDYGDMVIGERHFTMPTRAVHEMVHRDGSLKKNEITFEDCRRFEAVSELSFEIGAPSEPDLPRAPTTFDVPVDAELEVDLISQVSSEHSQVGDTVEAQLRRPLAADGLVIADKGARLLGRLRQMNLVGAGSDDSYYAVTLEFT